MLTIIMILMLKKDDNNMIGIIIIRIPMMTSENDNNYNIFMKSFINFNADPILSTL